MISGHILTGCLSPQEQHKAESAAGETVEWNTEVTRADYSNMDQEPEPESPRYMSPTIASTVIQTRWRGTAARNMFDAELEKAASMLSAITAPERFGQDDLIDLERLEGMGGGDDRSSHNFEYDGDGGSSGTESYIDLEESADDFEDSGTLPTTKDLHGPSLVCVLLSDIAPTLRMLAVRGVPFRYQLS